MNNRPPILAVLVLLTSSAYANDLTFPGFTGAIRTPDANVAPTGKIQYQYNNYNDLNAATDNTYNHVFAVGINAYIEVGGRLTDWYNDDRVANSSGTLPGKRDLSGNLKLRLPKAHRLLPDIAVGVQDFAGEAVNFRSVYGVLSKTIGAATVSVGYAKSDTGKLNDKFASLQVTLSPSLSLKTDYLDETFAVGLGINAKPVTGIPLSLQLAGEKQKNGEWDKYAGLTLHLPLDHKLQIPKAKISQFKLTAQNRNIAQFVQAAEQYGLTHLQLGTQGNIDVVLIENHTYNHSYLDALSVVLGHAYQHLGGKNPLRIVLSKQNKALLAVQIDMEDYGKYINGQPSTIHTTTKAWHPNRQLLSNVTWLVKHHRKAPIDIRLQPILRSNLGSEWGVFDYSAALRADVKIPLGKLADLVISGSVPIAHSDLYEEGNAFASRRYESQLDHAFIQKLSKPTPASNLLTSFGYSTIDKDEYIMGKVEGTHDLSTGKNQLFATAAYYRNQDTTRDDEIIALGGLRHHIDFLDMNLEVSYGHFFSESSGVKTKISKFYGDAELSAEIKYIDRDDLSGRLSITLPLTPQRDKQLGNVVVRGDQSWNYGIETTIKDPVVVGSNRVRPNYLLEPSLSYLLKEDVLDNGRLSPNHFINNLHQIRQRSAGLLKGN
ncbi:MAG: YjbH domain-containing protein [Leucothrix sp.]